MVPEQWKVKTVLLNKTYPYLKINQKSSNIDGDYLSYF